MQFEVVKAKAEAKAKQCGIYYHEKTNNINNNHSRLKVFQSCNGLKVDLKASHCLDFLSMSVAVIAVDKSIKNCKRM